MTASSLPASIPTHTNFDFSATFEDRGFFLHIKPQQFYYSSNIENPFIKVGKSVLTKVVHSCKLSVLCL